MHSISSESDMGQQINKEFIRKDFKLNYIRLKTLVWFLFLENKIAKLLCFNYFKKKIILVDPTQFEWTIFLLQ